LEIFILDKLPQARNNRTDKTSIWNECDTGMAKQSGDSPKRKRLKRDIARIELTRIEESARTVTEFENVGKLWDKLDENRERTERRGEQKISNDMFDWNFKEYIAYDENFIDLIYSCMCEMHLLTDYPDISRLVEKATEKQKEAFFSNKIAGHSTATIANYNGTTDRNVRKIVDLMVENIQRDLSVILQAKTDKKEPMTFWQRSFLKTYKAKQEKKLKKQVLKEYIDKHANQS